MTELAVGAVITDRAQLKALPIGALLFDGDFHYLICDEGLVVDDCTLVRRRKSLYIPTTALYPLRIVYLPEAPHV